MLDNGLVKGGPAYHFTKMIRAISLGFDPNFQIECVLYRYCVALSAQAYFSLLALMGSRST